MEKLNLDNNNLRKFGLTMAIAFLVITIFIFFKRSQIMLPVAAVSAAFFVLALASPTFLRPIYVFWMRLAFVLGWVNTRLILCIMFYLIFAPIGLIMRLFRIDPLERKIDKNKISYWEEKERKGFSPLDYQRQF